MNAERQSVLVIANKFTTHDSRWLHRQKATKDYV